MLPQWLDEWCMKWSRTLWRPSRIVWGDRRGGCSGAPVCQRSIDNLTTWQLDDLTTSLLDNFTTWHIESTLQSLRSTILMSVSSTPNASVLDIYYLFPQQYSNQEWKLTRSFLLTTRAYVSMERSMEKAATSKNIRQGSFARTRSYRRQTTRPRLYTMLITRAF